MDGINSVSLIGTINPLKSVQSHSFTLIVILNFSFLNQSLSLRHEGQSPKRRKRKNLFNYTKSEIITRISFKPGFKHRL